MMADDHSGFDNPNDYTRQFIPPPTKPRTMSDEDWATFSERMDNARRVRDGEVSGG
jgi:hypothetical protein